MKSIALVCLYLLVFLSPAAMAGKLNKCIAAGGAVTYTDKPCAASASTQTLETRSVPPAPGSDAALNQMVDKVFAVEQKACAEGDMHSCELLYCREDPGSRQCLQTTHRASGSGWYQISSQSAGLGKGRIGIHCTDVPLKQRRGIDIEADVSGRWTHKAGGREMDFSSLDAAARNACQSRSQR
jgi:hypothetical protein